MLFFLICASFALFPEKVLSGAGEGLMLCMNAVVPSLLPFMVASGCIIKSNFSRPLGAVLSKILSPLTKMSSAGCVCFVTGLIGGYGAGARAVDESFRNGCIGKKEAERLLGFCNNAGPLFIIGTVGVGLYGSKAVGVMLFTVQIITSVICARVFSGNFKRKTRVKEEWLFYKKNKPPAGELVTKSATESGSAIITACVFVILFSALLEVLPFGQYGILSGILEVTRGASEMSQAGGESLSLTSAFLAWGGISVHLQADALCQRRYSMKMYYIEKIFAALVAYIITRAAGSDMSILLVLIITGTVILLCAETVRLLLFPKSSLPLLFRQQRRS